MSASRLRRSLLTLLLAVVALGASSSSAWGAAGDPLFIFSPARPKPPAPTLPPPSGDFNGPCGLGVDSGGDFYVSDYYRHNVDVFVPNGYGPPPQFGAGFYVTQLSGVDPLDGPCGLALDAADNLYVNDYHRAVVKYGSKAGFGSGTVIAGAGVDDTQPTGVAVDPAGGDAYVDARDHVAVYDSSGAQVGEIGADHLADAYGIAYSQYPGTLGWIYVPDAATNTVKVFDPAANTETPVAEIDGAATPGGGFVSLRDAAVAVDRVTGDVYVVDNLEPMYAARPDAIVYVFGPDGTYKGHLKYLIRDALPAGLAVDNGTGPTQGRVYVTSGNTAPGSVYAYPPNAAVTTASKPTAFALTQAEAAPAAAAPTPVIAAAKARPPAVTGRRGEIQQVGNMRLRVSAKLAPKKLPRERLAPVGVSVGWNISSTDGSEPPQLKAIGIEINSHGVIDATGLPVCPYDKIQPASTDRALHNCRSSLVGTGNFSAQVGLEGQEGYLAKGRMLVFNGLEKGKPVLYAQLYSAYPFANSFVVVFKIDKRRQGAYGTTLHATLPTNLRDWGNLTEVNMSLSRKYTYKGRRRSFISASCPTPKGSNLALFRLAKTTFSFSGGTTLNSTLTETCKVKR
jgi:NHL repeat